MIKILNIFLTVVSRMKQKMKQK